MVSNPHWEERWIDVCQTAPCTAKLFVRSRSNFLSVSELTFPASPDNIVEIQLWVCQGYKKEKTSWTLSPRDGGTTFQISEQGNIWQ